MRTNESIDDRADEHVTTNGTSDGRLTTRVKDSTNVIATVLIGLAVLCAVSAGIFLFEIDEDLADSPPVNGSEDAAESNYAGIVGAQEVELRDEYMTRSFEERLTRSSSDESRAAVIESETRQIRSMLETLETRKADIRQSDGDNRTQLVSFVAESRTLEQRLDRVQQATQPLPPALRTEFGLTEQTFESLRDRILSLTTPAMNDRARHIAGDDVGDDLDGNREDNDNDDDDDNDNDDDDEEEDYGDPNE